MLIATTVALTILSCKDHSTSSEAFSPSLHHFHRHGIPAPQAPSHMPLFYGRDLTPLIDWANENQVQGIGDTITFQADTGGGFGVTVPQPLEKGSTLLMVPSSLVLNSEQLRKEWNLKDAEAFLEDKKIGGQIPQFYLYVKLLREHDKRELSKWFAWLQSLPRDFSTAVSMDEVELECLPPFAWALASVERLHLDLFRQALEKVPKEILDHALRQDDDLTEWIFNCVFTRCWSYPDDDDDEEAEFSKHTTEKMDRCDLVPLGDMFNHNANQTIDIQYTPNGEAHFLTRYNAEPDTPLHLSYGKVTNPHRLLVIFGFVDTSIPEIFCQILVNEPSDELVKIGYATDKMVFRTHDGAIATAVWDVILYSILEQVPEQQRLFYQACIDQTDLRSQFHAKYRLETAITISRYVSQSLTEVQELLHSKVAAAEQDDRDHPRLDLIKRHNEFMSEVFQKVRNGLDDTIREELANRKAAQKGQSK